MQDRVTWGGLALLCAGALGCGPGEDVSLGQEARLHIELADAGNGLDAEPDASLCPPSPEAKHCTTDVDGQLEVDYQLDIASAVCPPGSGCQLDINQLVPAGDGSLWVSATRWFPFQTTSVDHGGEPGRSPGDPRGRQLWEDLVASAAPGGAPGEYWSDDGIEHGPTNLAAYGADGSPVWSHDMIREVSGTSLDWWFFALMSDAQGGLTIAASETPGSAPFEGYARRLDADGTPQWLWQVSSVNNAVTVQPTTGRVFCVQPSRGGRIRHRSRPPGQGSDHRHFGRRHELS